jgi:hypothetical protein
MARAPVCTKSWNIYDPREYNIPFSPHPTVRRVTPMSSLCACMPCKANPGHAYSYIQSLPLSLTVVLLYIKLDLQKSLVQVVLRTSLIALCSKLG